VVATVEDNGEGIPEEMQKKIFDPFFTTREVGIGMGLGLSIVDRIVRGFSGYIEVTSTPGRGSCFAVSIPQYIRGASSSAPRQSGEP
jgi:signal transduction histidine kinase